MSAFDVKVGSDKQTLILAGETPPLRRVVVDGSQQSASTVELQRVTVLLLQGEYAPALATQPALPYSPGSAAISAVGTAVVSVSPTQSLIPFASSNRRRAAGSADAYARTQTLGENGARAQSIDTYA